MRRRGHASDATIFAGEHPLDVLGREFAQARLHQRSDDAAAHSVEEAVAFDDDCEQPPGLLNVAARQGADGGFPGVA